MLGTHRLFTKPLPSPFRTRIGSETGGLEAAKYKQAVLRDEGDCRRGIRAAAETKSVATTTELADIDCPESSVIPPASMLMPYISQPPVAPGGKFIYEFTLNQAGTFFYHSHGAMQEMMGMIGMFVIHPAKPWAPQVDHDFGIVMQEWAILPNNDVPNTANMEFNWLTFNGKAAPDTTPIVVRHGSRVRVRLVNMGMDHHPIHLHERSTQRATLVPGPAPNFRR